MKVLSSYFIVNFIILLISPLEADNCVEVEAQLILVIFEDELDVHHWYGSDGKTLISMDQNSRAHQYREILWFAPAATEDTGYYYCVERNSTHCHKEKFKIEILKKNPGICHNEQNDYIKKLPIGPGGFIVCTHLDIFKDENNNLPKVQWYKDWKPLLDTRFQGKKKDLFLDDIQKVDQGHYTLW
uniref:Uncharacterized protein n=1 Tax=Monodelphis domestica TaxID=13616 RepID=A0A5F8GKR8_MONDO